MRKLVTLGLFTICAAPAMAAFTDINSVAIRERYAFNHFPNSNLVIVDNYPTLVSFAESNFGANDPNAGDFANMSEAVLAINEVPYQMQRSEGFSFRVTAYLEAINTGQRKEAGIAMHSDDDPYLDNLFIITSDGEVAAFGGQFPFYLFGPQGTYVPGTYVEMGVDYAPDDDADPNDGDASQVRYIYNGIASPWLSMSNIENGFLDGTEMVVYSQNNPDSTFPGDFAYAEYTNFQVPEPASLALLALAGLLIRRR